MFIVEDGLPYVIVTLLLGAVVLFIARGSYWAIPGWLIIVIGLFFAYFFRDPVRKINADEHAVLSPADGTVLEVINKPEGKAVRIFLSVFNVHSQRAPVDGKITNVEYKPGKFLPAMEKDAHIVNEQNKISIESKKGSYKVYQIAGILARRVVSWVKAGDEVKQGQKIGFIKFGSQVDIEMPASATIQVKEGEKVRAGITVLAEIK